MLDVEMLDKCREGYTFINLTNYAFKVSIEVLT